MDTIISIHQIGFLPWIGYFSKIASVDKFVILDHLQFSAGQFENRVKIKTKSGVQWLSIPIKKESVKNLTIREVEIDYTKKWQRKFINLLTDSYQKTQFFDKYFPTIKKIILENKRYLFDINLILLQYLLEILKIKTPIFFSSELSLPKIKSHEMNMYIINKLGGTIYLSGIMGEKYLIEDEFLKNKIKLQYQDIDFPSYTQLWGNFVPGLSIVDYIFNCGEKNFNYLIKNNNL